MGQKINPHGFRVGVIKDWDSRWFVGNEKFGDTLVSDYQLRTALKKRLHDAGVPKIEIERDAARVRIFIHCSKPGMVIGRGGSEIDKLKTDIEKMVGGKPVTVNVVEIKNPDMDAQLVAENIASQLERRSSFRRAMKQSIARTMRSGAKGIKVRCGGRLNGAEIARSETYHEGTIPLQTLRADIDYGQWEANTTYGKIGVKVWIYKGEVLDGSKTGGRAALEATQKSDKPRRDRRDRDGDRRDRGGRRDRRDGDRRDRGERSSERSSDRRPGGSRDGGRTSQGGQRGGRSTGGRYQQDNRPAFSDGRTAPRSSVRNQNAAQSSDAKSAPSDSANE